MQEQPYRRLVAIMFTDIVGYSALMQQNEKQAVATVKRHQEVLEAGVVQYGGEVLQYYGDGSLSIFDSAAGAVQCALKLQQRYQEPPQVPLRIGIHIGEVLFENGNVFGDGVNIAARIEAIGIPGSVLFSKRVNEEIRNKPHLESQYLGNYNLKNIQEPMKIYSLIGEGLNIPEKKNPSLERTPFLDSKQRKSIVVLPFENQSSDSDQEYFSDGLTDELITDLSNLKALRVIARNTTMKLKGSKKELHTLSEELQVQYALVGSIRQSSDQLRINAQLVDIKTGSTLWASRFTGKLEKVFDFQEEVSRSIADALHLQLNQKEEEGLAKRPIPNLVAYDYYLRARKEINTFSEVGVHQALDYLEKGIEIIGEKPVLLYGQGATYFQMLNSGISIEDDLYEKIEVNARRILELDSRDGRGYLLLGMCKVRKDFREAVLEWRRALALNPGDPDTLLWLGVHSLSTGQAAFGSALLEELVRIEPLVGLNLACLAYAAYFDGRLADIKPLLHRAIELGINDNPIALFCAVRLFLGIGLKKEALQQLDLLVNNHPDTPFTKASSWLIEALNGHLPSQIFQDEKEFLDWVSRDAEFSQFLLDVFALAGMDEEALIWLKKAAKVGFINYPFLAYHGPFLSNLRRRKEFQEIISTIKQDYESFNSRIEVQSNF